MAGRQRKPSGPLIAAGETRRLLAAMAKQLQARLRDGRGPVTLVGIANGGVWVAQRLQALLPGAPATGALDINFYRDDYGRTGFHKVKPSSLPLTLEDHRVVLVDDVLHTGRTVRAALNALFDLGRPAQVILAVLVDRGGRELPIAADVIGKTVEPGPRQHLEVRGPDPLEVWLAERGA
jgi:pyrimidine operon attenuation protein / uracil phosphoribosyltransferase